MTARTATDNINGGISDVVKEQFARIQEVLGNASTSRKRTEEAEAKANAEEVACPQPLTDASPTGDESAQ